MRVLITGGAGFIGSRLILYWLEKHPGDQILNLDKLSYAANLALLAPVQNHPQYAFSQTDLCERKAVRTLLREFQPEAVLHLAAESHVDKTPFETLRRLFRATWWAHSTCLKNAASFGA